MKSYSNIGLRPIRSAYSGLESKKNDFIPTFSSLESAKANYSKKTSSDLRVIRFSPNSQNSSKDTQSNSEKSFSQDTSSNENSKIITPSSLSSLRDPTPQSNRSEQNKKNKTPKETSLKNLSRGINTLNEISLNLESGQKGNPPPQITAKCWAIMNGKTGEMVYSRMENRKREVASLTKMMNLLCVCRLIKEFDIDPKETHIKVSKNAASMKGTSAFLKAGDLLSVWDLLHGLMLPSGNDAAMALAENFGTFLYLRSDEYKAKCNRELTNTDTKNPTKYFIRMMNETANELGMYFTQYANPHGLVNSNSYSTAADQAKLSYHLLKLDVVRRIVNTKSYTCQIEQADRRIRVSTWENTNKLLHKEGWGGIKTGITTAAGPCLSAYYEKQGESYIVILLNSFSMEIRWIEAPKLVEWAIKNKTY